MTYVLMYYTVKIVTHYTYICMQLLIMSFVRVLLYVCMYVCACIHNYTYVCMYVRTVCNRDATIYCDTLDSDDAVSIRS